MVKWSKKELRDKLQSRENARKFIENELEAKTPKGKYLLYDYISNIIKGSQPAV